MIEQSGQLMKIVDGKARVRLGGQSGCPACDAGEGCGAGLFGRLLRRRPVELELENDIGAVPGQAVKVGLPESAFLSLVWHAYGLPLLAGLAGAVICHQIMIPVVQGGPAMDAVALAGGVVAAGLCWRVMTRRALRRLARWPVQLLTANPGQRACAGKLAS